MAVVSPSSPPEVAQLTSQEAWLSFISTLQQSSILALKGGPVDCKANASDIFAALNDSSTWKDWCSFIPKLEIVAHGSDPTKTLSGDLIPGTRVNWGIVLDPKNPEKLTMSTVEVDAAFVPQQPGDSSFFVTWSSRGMLSLIHTGRRVWHIEDLSSGSRGGDGQVKSRITTWDFQSGPLTWLVSWIYGNRLKEAFEGTVRDLKGYCER